MTDASETVTSPLKLESLVPRFVSDQHGTYRDELVDLLTDDGRRARVWNIALTGGYGSGKSSVLAGVRDQLGKRVVEISLSSLSDVGVESGDDLNNYIQKEIVKQLLYRERPSRVPGSRFKRISRLPVGRTLLASALVAVLVVLTLGMIALGQSKRVAHRDPQSFRRPKDVWMPIIHEPQSYACRACFHDLDRDRLSVLVVAPPVGEVSEPVTMQEDFRLITRGWLPDGNPKHSARGPLIGWACGDISDEFTVVSVHRRRCVSFHGFSSWTRASFSVTLAITRSVWLAR